MMGQVRQAVLAVHEFLIPARLGAGYLPYLWLVYHGFLFLPLIFGRPAASTVIVTWVSVAIFLPVYFLAYRYKGKDVLPFVAILTGLGLMVAPFNPGSPVYFIHACAFAALAGPPALAVRYMSLVVLIAACQVLWMDLHPTQAIVAALIGFVVGACNIFYRKMDLKNEALRLSREEVKRLASTAERERIARDLHDLLGHTLASITLKAELARRTVTENPERARQELAEIERVSRQATAQVRAAVAGYRAGRIQSELASARHLLESSGLWFDYELDEFDLNAEHENVLALALREALTNVVRHARATRCWVVLQQDDTQTRLLVRDDGRGGRVRPGSGIKGMRERLKEVGGQVNIESNTPSGIIVEVVLPHPESPEEIGALEPAPMIRVLIAEDQTMVLGALAALLDLESDIEVVGRAGDGREALAMVESESPDIVLTDIEMPHITGLELAQRLQDDATSKVIILTTFGRPGYLRRALECGVMGYLLKDAPSEKLADALRTVHRGGRVIDPELAAQAWTDRDPLTDRERQVLRLAGEGRSSTEIADQLHLSQGTVRNYLSEAIGKLGASNRIEAARLARQKGWL